MGCYPIGRGQNPEGFSRDAFADDLDRRGGPVEQNFRQYAQISVDIVSITWSADVTLMNTDYSFVFVAAGHFNSRTQLNMDPFSVASLA